MTTDSSPDTEAAWTHAEALLDAQQVELLDAELHPEWLAWTDAFRERRPGWQSWARALYWRLLPLYLRGAHAMPAPRRVLDVLEVTFAGEMPRRPGAEG